MASDFSKLNCQQVKYSPEEMALMKAEYEEHERERSMLQLTMVGAAFRPAEAKEIVRALTIGDKVQLRADPNNEYDTTAVAVYHDDVHIGFIPKESNSAIFAVLMDGAQISAEVIAFESTLKPILEIHFDSMPADDLVEQVDIGDGLPYKPQLDQQGIIPE
jgi:hypothetical protein